MSVTGAASSKSRDADLDASLAHPPAPRLIAEVETMRGRLVLRGHDVRAAGEDAGAGPDPFRERRFEVTEVGETLALEKRVRVYEELVIRKDATTRVETVGAVLRREGAEVVVDGENAPEIMPAPRPDTA